ncbi:MAG: ATP-binding protein [Pseudomonadota bacterium]
MTEKTIEVPDRLTLVSHVERLGLDRLDLSGFTQCNLRFSNCSFGEPLPMLLLAKRFSELVRRHPDVAFQLRSRESQFRGYAEHIGYFRLLGFGRGNRPGEAIGSSTYIPIERLSISEMIERAGNQPIGRAVSGLARRLSTLLSQHTEGPLFDLFEYSFREIIRNSLEHSCGEELILFGQYWPARDRVEIVVMDDGVGIAENLYENEHIECKTNADALKFAILPGITGVPRAERVEQDERWGNSGFGLYVTSRLCSEGGLFRLLSGSGSLTLANGVRTEHPWPFGGTCVQLRFSTRDAASRIQRIEEIVTEGKQEWQAIVGEIPVAASAASRMLASHFDHRGGY